jgi:hypothetical protein
MRAKRRDANEGAIVKALEAIGATVLRCDHPDLIVGYTRPSGYIVNLLLEVKTDGGRLRPSQHAMLRTWKGQYAIVRSIDEAVFVVTSE